ncbi:MAG: hypothetical protein JXL67_01675 [Calditrichaeota bacterium]|nr:hypothetical protein [Calditrichota bacterium]
MKKQYIILFIIVAMVNLLAFIGFAGDDKAKGESKYMVVLSHTPQECLTQLDRINAKGADVLNKFDWGCKSGVHTGYALIKSQNESEVINMLPSDEKKQAEIVKVDKFTPEELEKIHKKM